MARASSLRTRRVDYVPPFTCPPTFLHLDLSAPSPDDDLQLVSAIRLRGERVHSDLLGNWL